MPISEPYLPTLGSEDGGEEGLFSVETLKKPFPTSVPKGLFCFIPAWGISKTACTHYLYITTEAEVP